MKLIHIYLATTAKAPRNQRAYAGYVLEYDTAGGPLTLSDFKELVDVTRNQADLLALIEALRHLKNRGMRLQIYTDSDHIASAFEKGWIENWVRAGWKTAKGAPVKNKEEWIEVLRLLAGQAFCFEVKQPHEYSGWLERELRKREEKDV